jgi:septal ring factor EnvC (AmiA/AmiB activator)
MDRGERREILAEAVRMLESVRLDPGLVGETTFEEAQADSRLATALSAARSALALLEREPTDPGEVRYTRNP